MALGLTVPLVLALVAFVTATISGIIGMGGGILLLATLFCFLSHGEAIPTHAAVQIVSNSTRVLALLRHVDWPTVGRFALGAMPGAVIGSVVLWSFGDPGSKEPYLKIVVGLYVLSMALLPNIGARPTRMRRWDFPLLGLLAGAAALTVGAIGPLIAPLFARRGFIKERLVATKAMCQMILHVFKIPAFLWLRSLDYERLGTMALLMGVLVIPGTILGKRILKNVTPGQFVTLYRMALLIAGLKVLCYDGFAQIL